MWYTVSMVKGHTIRFSWYTGALLFSLALGYGIFQAHDLLTGPSLTLLAPQNGAVVYEPFVVIEGYTKHATTLHMGARPILTREDGSFREPFLLAEGYNKIPLLAEDRFGTQKEASLEIVYDASAQGRNTGALPSSEHVVKK